MSRAVKRAVFEFYTYRLSYTSLASKIISSRTEDHGIYHGELSVKIFFPFIFFPANHFPQQEVPFPKGSRRAEIDLTFPERFARLSPIFCCAVVPRIYRGNDYSRLFLSPDQLQLVARINRSRGANCVFFISL